MHTYYSYNDFIVHQIEATKKRIVHHEFTAQKLRVVLDRFHQDVFRVRFYVDRIIKWPLNKIKKKMIIYPHFEIRSSNQNFISYILKSFHRGEQGLFPVAFRARSPYDCVPSLSSQRPARTFSSRTNSQAQSRPSWPL